MQNDETLKNWVVISACLHTAAVVFLYFGLPTIFKPLPGPPLRVIPINIVEIGAITNTRLPGQPELAAKAAPPAPKPEEKKAPPTPEPKPKPEVKPEAKPEPPKPAEKPDEQPDEAALPKPQSKPKPPERPKVQQQQQDQLASILKNLTKAKPQPSKVDQIKQLLAKDGGKTEGTAADGAQNGGIGPSLSDRLTISAEDALRRQISNCWNIPAGARNAQDLIVEVLIDVNPDRTVREAHVVDQSRLATDSYFRAAAESALRALRNPKCTPLELPPDQYEQWKTIRFTFDPRDML
jgi:outer membrane biosynthesis protein TonB